MITFSYNVMKNVLSYVVYKLTPGKIDTSRLHLPSPPLPVALLGEES